MINVNVVKLVGEISKSGDGKFLINIARGAQALAMKVFGPTDGLKEGSTVEVIGKLVPDRSGGATVTASTITKTKKGTEHEAMVKIVAKCFRSHAHRPATSDKSAFGYGTLVSGDPDKPKEAEFFRYVAFSPLSESLRDQAKRGSIVELVGTLRRRFFEKDGLQASSIDIVAQEDLTKVLRKAEVIDPFAGIAPTPAFESEATDEVPF